MEPPCGPHGPDMAPLEAEVSPELLVLCRELSVGYLASPLCLSRMEWAGWLSALGHESGIASLSCILFQRFKLSWLLLHRELCPGEMALEAPCKLFIGLAHL